jgi:broad specificity phosphatase PhoE
MANLRGALNLLIGLLAILVAEAATGAASARERSIETTLTALKGGGHVILMRHAFAPDGQVAPVGLTAGCDFSDRRGLDAKGFFQARFIGEFLKSEGVPVGRALTSDVCRAYDTARLVAAGAPVAAEPALKSTDRSLIDALKTSLTATLASGEARTNVVLVTHSNVLPLIVDWAGEGEIPSGVILIVDPASWTVTEKFNLDVDLTVGE